jgi:phosphoglucosamine mutase
VQAAVRKVEDRFAGRGRIVLRPSGTEPVIRVMVEGEESSVVTDSAREIAAAVELAAAAA